MKGTLVLIPGFLAVLALGSALVALATVGGCAPAETPPAAPGAPVAPPEPPFYAGKTLRFIVATEPGGGFDVYTRLVAKYIGKYIPGNPSPIVENMPGAGGLVAANHLYKVAKPDGLTIGMIHQGRPLQQLTGGEGVEYDARKFHWLAAPSTETIVCILRADRGIKTAQEFLASPQPVVLGALAPGTSLDDFGKLLKEALGANIKLVSGYRGTATVRLAIEKGEVEGACWGWNSIKTTAKEMLESGLVIPIIQQGRRRHADLPQVPLMTDLAKTEEARTLLRLRMASELMPRPFVAPPGVPQERVTILRQGFSAVFKDSELLAEAEKAELEISPVPGEEIARLIEEMFKASPEVVKKLAEVLK